MITLWGRNNSTNVKKVLLTLEELELPYEQILAGREFGINHDADFLAMNPNGLVPLLRDDESDLILWESNAIVRYLAAQYGQKRLWGPAAPTAGTFEVGDRMDNSAPAAGEASGWVCVTAGTPGTWKDLAPISL